jgi:hypothetical protein
MAAMAIAGASVVSAESPRFYYDPAAKPFPQNYRKVSPPLRKKRPHSTADFMAIGRAVVKRERKAERRLRTGQ